MCRFLISNMICSLNIRVKLLVNWRGEENKFGKSSKKLSIS